MFRLTTIAIILLATNISFAGDLLPIVFEDSSVMLSGDKVECDLYYILIGDNGSLDRGDLLQIVQLKNDREHYGIVKARFSASKDLDKITIFWPAKDSQKFGAVEKARLKITDADSLRISYEIYQHDDKSQVGEKQRARIIDFQQLPKWIHQAASPSIIAKLSPEEQLLYHKMQAKQLETSSKIIESYLDIVD